MARATKFSITRGLTLSALVLLAAPAAHAQDAVRVTGFVQGVTTLSLQTQTSFVVWDSRQAMNDTVLAVFDILSNATAGYELVLLTNAVGGADAFQFALRYDEQPVQFQGNQAVLERVSSRDGPTARGGKALTMTAPPQSVTNAGVQLTFVIRAP